VRGAEADVIADAAVAERGADGGAFVFGVESLVEMVPLELGVWMFGREAAPKDFLVGREPLEAEFPQHRDDFRADGTFRRPESAWRLAEKLRVIVTRKLKLGACVLGMQEARRKPAARHRPSGVLAVAEQRQDRVIERRRRDLDLSPVGSGLVTTDETGQNALLASEENLLVLLGEIAPLLFQLADFGIKPLRRVAEPREVEPDLQVAQLLFRERGGDARQLG